MPTNEMLLVMVLGGLAVSAIVAQKADRPAWQGPVIIMAGFAVGMVLAALLPVESQVLLLISSASGTALAGNMLKMTWRQIAAIYVAGMAGAFVAGVLWSRA